MYMIHPLRSPIVVNSGWIQPEPQMAHPLEAASLPVEQVVAVLVLAPAVVVVVAAVVLHPVTLDVTRTVLFLVLVLEYIFPVRNSQFFRATPPATSLILQDLQMGWCVVPPSTETKTSCALTKALPQALNSFAIAMVLVSIFSLLL